MARYGATPLARGKWYYLVGRYDAAARRLDVYLNGQPDNGTLVGHVTGTQHSSRGAVYIGRRSDLPGYESDGLMKDVRIYSLALSEHEIAVEMSGKSDGSVIGRRPEKNADPPVALIPQNQPCALLSEPEDTEIPPAAAMLGVLSAVAFVGLFPALSPKFAMVISFVAGLLILPALSFTLPTLNLWTIPLISLAGGASVSISMRTVHSKDCHSGF